MIRIDEQVRSDVQLVEKAAEARRLIEAEVAKRIVGQASAVEQLLVCLFARGHGLLVGVPGLAKTLMVRTLADAMSLGFGRIQFTPDLMPSDITGTDILEETPEGKRCFRFVEGPIFCQLLLADEINRTPPKTQAALLQAMQEQNVTAGGRTYPLPPPFHVFATQNPIEQEGTYPLPEAQLDRFMMEILIGYPSPEEEAQIVRQGPMTGPGDVEKVIGSRELQRLQDLVARMPVADHVVDFAVRLVRSTRPDAERPPEEIRRFVSWGAGPRATQMLVAAARARAALHGRFAVQIEDLEALALPVLRHRLVTAFHAEAEGIRRERIVAIALAEAKKQTDR